MDEKDLATQQAQAGQDPRLPGPDEDQGRAEGAEAQAAEGAPPPHRVTPPQLGAGQAGGPGKPPHPGPGRDGGSKASQASSPKKAGGKGLVSLKGDRAFQRLKKGRSGRGRLVLVRWLPRQEGVAVGIVVSKKVGKAVVRNKVRRRIREILRRLHLPPADLLVIAQPEAKDAGFAELARDLFLALKKSGLVQ